jgi:hypothetical protein
VTRLATHLGAVRMSSTHCTPLTDQMAGGDMTLVATNGDKVSTSLSPGH